jgi:methionyl aminopeptidase
MNKITHGKWNFDNNSGKHTFKITNDTFDNNYFQYEESTDNTDEMKDFRRASIIHRIVRSEVKKVLHDKIKFIDIINTADTVLDKLKKDNKNIGYAFPIGISVNEIVVHDSTFFINDPRCLRKGDVVKIDIGIHVNGHIIDSAFTEIVDENIEEHSLYPLIEASRDATFSCIALSGVDVRIKELSEVIQEVIESYEVNGEKIHAIEGLGGHNILPYQVHGGKLILSVPDSIQDNMIMKENEIYAIETFASTGYGKVTQVLDDKNKPMTHFMMNRKIFEYSTSRMNKLLKNDFMNWVVNERKGMPFTPLWCSHIKNALKEINQRVMNGDVVAFPALTDKIGSFTSQLEHTIYIGDKKLEILSLGNDY